MYFNTVLYTMYEMYRTISSKSARHILFYFFFIHIFNVMRFRDYNIFNIILFILFFSDPDSPYPEKRDKVHNIIIFSQIRRCYTILDPTMIGGYKILL